jgi:hypothetical protein
MPTAITIFGVKAEHLRFKRIATLTGFRRWYMVYETRMFMDYIHRPIFSIDHDVSETASLRNVVIYRNNRTMDIVHKHSSLVETCVESATPCCSF